MNVLINIGHGNAPYLNGTKTAKALEEKLGDVRIIVPHVYGANQERILQENGLLSESVILDKELGDICQTTVYSGDYNSYVSALLEQRKSKEESMRRHLRKRYGTIDVEINTGSRVTSDAPVYFMFPVLLSELLRYTTKERDLVGMYDKDILLRFADMMKVVEDDYRRIFMPAYHTLSFDKNRIPQPNEVSVPLLGVIPPSTDIDLKENSVYVMLSGTGSGTTHLLDHAQQLREQGYNVIIPPWAQGPYQKETPDVIAHKNVRKVVARAGLGTIWLCQMLGKEFEPIEIVEGDDPEIYFNIKTLQNKPLKAAAQEIEARFGTLDGLSFIAEQLALEMR